MRYHSNLMKAGTLTVVLILVSCLLPGAACSQETASRQLFKPVPQHKAVALPAETEKKLSTIRNDVGTKGLWVVEISMDLLQSKSLSLNVNSETSMDASTARVEKRSEKDFTWVGKITGAKTPGEAVLTVKDGLVFGTIQAEKGMYEIVPLGSGQHAIVEIDQSQFPPDEGPDYAPGKKDPGEIEKPHTEPRSQGSVDRSERTADGKYIIEVIVAYTAAARNRAGGKNFIEGEIQKAIDLTNQSYVNSKVNIQMAQAHIYETNYDESRETWPEDLKRFRTKGDGHMEEVHSLRDQYRGDIAVLVVDKHKNGKVELCGLASDIGAHEGNAFCMVHLACLNKMYTFGHEIGHLQGAAHNWEADWTVYKDYQNNHAFWYKAQDKRKNWRTMMSYDCPGQAGLCPRRLYWSSPDVLVDGVPTGTRDCCDNTSVLNTTAKKVSGFR